MITFTIDTTHEKAKVIVRFIGNDWREADPECTMAVELAGEAVGEPVRIADDYDVEKDETFLLFLFHDWLDGAYLIPPQRVDVKRLSPLNLVGALSTWGHPYTVDGPPQPLNDNNRAEEDDVPYIINPDGTKIILDIPKRDMSGIVY